MKRLARTATVTFPVTMTAKQLAFLSKSNREHMGKNGVPAVMALSADILAAGIENHMRGGTAAFVKEITKAAVEEVIALLTPDQRAALRRRCGERTNAPQKLHRTTRG